MAEVELTGPTSAAPPPVAVVVESQPVQVEIPQGAKVGQVVAIQGTPVGQANIAVPDGVKPGQVIQVLMPVTAQPLEGLSGLASFLGNSAKLEVNQKVRLAEALTGGCCEQQNIFDVKLNDKDGPRVLTAKEKSDCIDRICCKPHHSFLLHLAPTFNEEQVLVTLERRGCECTKCCFSPRPFLGCCTCSELCTEEIIIHEGRVLGKPGAILEPRPVAVIKQPLQCCKPKGCTPTLDIFQWTGGNMTGQGDFQTSKGNLADVPSGSIVGPMCFGGCSELCIPSAFHYTSTDGGEAADIIHLIPRNCGELCKAVCTDSDNYSIDLSGAKTPELKANAVLASLVLDTMFFEIDQGMCHYDPNAHACVITCCLCFCYGCLIPCECYIPCPKEGGGPPSPEQNSGAPPAPDVIITHEPALAAPASDIIYRGHVVN